MSQKYRSSNSANKNSPQYRGLFAWWPLNITGSNSVFETERGITGTIVGIDPLSAWATSKEREGHILSFDGAGYVNCGDVDVVDQVGTDAELTWSVWTNLDTTTGTEFIINKQAPTENAGFGLRWNTTNGWEFRIGTNYGYTGPSGYSANTWYHIAVVYNGNLTGDSNRLKIYVNGIERSLTFSGSIPATITTSTSELLFGAQNTAEVLPFWSGDFSNFEEENIFSALASPGNPMNGKLDDIRLYRRSLLSSEIQQLWNPQTKWELYEKQDPAIFTTLSLASGGIVVNGDAESIFRYNVTGSGGTISGNDVQPLATYNIIGSGGLVAGGDAINNVRDNETGDGGLVAGGDAINNVRDNEVGSGGLVVGGDVEPIVRYNEIGSGGLVVNGSADENFSDVFETTGGIIVNGTATNTQEQNNNATGGIILEGSAEIAFIDYIDATGGLVAGGDAVNAVRNNETGTGGVVANGDVEPLVRYNITGDGGLVAGGDAQPSGSADFIGSGGLVASGDAINTISNNETGSGGLVADGEATNTVTDNEVGSGGLVAGGDVEPLVQYNITSDGGLVSSGDTVNTVRNNEVSSGGLVSSGDVEPSGNFDFNVSGGITVGGDAQSNKVIDVVAASEGMFANGEANPVSNYNITSDGGAIVGGRALLLSIFSDNDKSPGITWNTNIRFSIKDGQLLVVIFATDNDDSIDGNTNLHNTITIGGQPMVKAREYTNSEGSPDAGATVSIWYLLPIGDIEAGATVATSLNSGRTAKAITGFVLEVGRGLRLHLDGATDDEGTISDPGSTSASGIRTTEDHLWIRGIALENANETIGWMTPTSGWEKFEDNGSTGNPPSSNISVRGEWSITTSSASSGTTDPTVETGADYASTLIGLSIDPLKTWNQFIEGGGSLGGSAEISYTINEIGVGGIVINGNTMILGGNDFMPDGGAALGGTAEENLNDIVEVSGGIITNGSAIYTQEQNNDTSSGIVINGSADITSVINISVTGGIVTNGEALISGSENLILEGGTVTGGSADITSVIAVDVTGGIVTNGEVLISGSGITSSDGGTVAGGSADITSVIAVDVTGGIVTNGEATIAKSQSATSEGGVVCGGESIIEFIANINGNSGVVVNGTIQLNFFDYIDGTGGIVCEGHAPTDYNFDGTGGVVAGGFSFPYRNIIDETSQGGITCGGSAIVIEDRIYILVECPEGYYVCAPKDQDAYCLKFINFISYGSKVFKVRSKDIAKIPPITLCRQGVGNNKDAYAIGATEDVVFEGSPSGIRTEIQETTEEQAVSLLNLPELKMLSAVEIPQNQTIKTKAAISNLKLENYSPVVNTPQMAQLKKANDKIRNKKNTPEQSRTVVYKRMNNQNKAPSVPDKPRIIQEAL